MPPRLQLAVMALMVSGITVFALAGSSRLSGPVILTFTPDHGVHVDDLFVVALWASCMGWFAWRARPRRGRRRRSSR